MSPDLPPGITPELIDKTLRDNSDALDLIVGKILAAAEGQQQQINGAFQSVLSTVRKFASKSIKRQQQVLDAIVGNIGGVVGGQIESNAQTLADIRGRLADLAIGQAGESVSTLFSAAGADPIVGAKASAQLPIDPQGNVIQGNYILYRCDERRWQAAVISTIDDLNWWTGNGWLIGYGPIAAEQWTAAGMESLGLQALAQFCPITAPAQPGGDKIKADSAPPMQPFTGPCPPGFGPVGTGCAPSPTGGDAPVPILPPAPGGLPPPPVIPPPAPGNCPPCPPSTTVTKCEYPALPTGYYYTKGPQYDPSTNCGMVIVANPTPAVKCTVPDWASDGIPAIGSEEFCKAEAQIRQLLTDAGNWIIENLEDLSGLNTLLEPLKDSTSFSDIADLMSHPWRIGAAFLRGLLTSTGDWYNQLRASINCWKQVLQKVSPCDWQALLPLVVLRTAIRAFKHTRFGTDAGLWLTTDIDVSIPQLERIIDYFVESACPSEIPGVNEAYEAYLAHTVTPDQLRCWFRMHGVDPAVWKPVTLAKRTKLDPEQAIEWFRRNDGTPSQIDDYLRQLGYTQPSERTAVAGLFDHLPTIQDHLHWLQRNVFDSQYVRDYNLLDGFSDDATISNLLGRAYTSLPAPAGKPDFWATFGHDLRALGMRQQYAANHYAAHWINPSIGQLAEMAQRLRPGRVDPSIAFTWDDFNRVLAEQDVAPYFRKRFAFTAFRTLPLRQINAASQQGRFNREELVNRWQDIGFTLHDSEVMADTSLVQAARQVASAGHGYTAAFVSQLAQHDLITRADAINYLQPQGFTAGQVDTLFAAAHDKARLAAHDKHADKSIEDYARATIKGYEEGAIDHDSAILALSNARYSPHAANLALSTVDLRVRMESVQSAIKAIHSGYKLGATDVAGAVNALRLAGVTLPMAQVYAGRWALEMSVQRKALATGAVLRLAKKGIMSVANARERLANLGWAPGDIQIQLAEISQEIQQAQARAAERTQKSLAQARLANERATALIRKGYCKLYTPAKMVRWYALRIIDESVFRQRLGFCGYSAEDTQRLFEEATVARAAKDAKAAKSGSSGVEYTGPGADTSNTTGEGNPGGGA